MLDLPFQITLLAAALVLAFAVRRDLLRPRTALVAILLGAPVLAALLARDVFHLFRLAAWAVFLHAPLWLLAGAWWFRSHQRRAAVCGIAALILGLIALDAFIVEPHALEVTTFHRTAPALRQPVRVVVLADLQTDAIGEYEREVFRTVRSLQPDLLLLPGDYLQLPPARRAGQAAALRGLFAGLAPPLGIWAVRGNVEPASWPWMFEGTEVHTLPRTETVTLRPDLRLTGLSLGDSFAPSLSIPAAPGAFHIVFGHAPDFALGRVEAQLLVAGHTHGGQVRLPGIGPLLTFSRVPRGWAAGLTELGEGRALVVSRGLGMERGNAPRLRFLCRPQIVVLDLEPAAVH